MSKKVAVDRKDIILLTKLVQEQQEQLKEKEEVNDMLRKAISTKSVTERIKPPARSEDCLKQKFTIGKTTSGYITIGHYPNGSPAEVFVSIGKSGEMVEGLCDSLARIISISLQCGVSVNEIVNALKDTDFYPNGPVEHDPDIKGAKSIPDYIARFLATNYISRRKTKQEKVEETIETIKELSGEELSGMTQCPSCSKKTLKPYAAGCNSVCANCGHIEVKGCGAND